MPFVPFANGIETVIQWQSGGRDIDNVINFVASVEPDLTLLGNLGTSIIDAILASDWFASALSNKIELVNIKLTSLNTETAPTVDWITGTSLSLPQTAPGSVVASANNVALVVTHHTPLRGRSFRGRTYLGGLRAGAFNSPTVVDGAYVTFALDLLDAIKSAGVANSCVLSVFSRQHNGVHLTTGVATAVTSFSCNPESDSQKNRLLKGH